MSKDCGGKEGEESDRIEVHDDFEDCDNGSETTEQNESEGDQQWETTAALTFRLMPPRTCMIAMLAMTSMKLRQKLRRPCADRFKMNSGQPCGHDVQRPHESSVPDGNPVAHQRFSPV